MANPSALSLRPPPISGPSPDGIERTVIVFSAHTIAGRSLVQNIRREPKFSNCKLIALTDYNIPKGRMSELDRYAIVRRMHIDPFSPITPTPEEIERLAGLVTGDRVHVYLICEFLLEVAP